MKKCYIQMLSFLLVPVFFSGCFSQANDRRKNSPEIILNTHQQSQGGFVKYTDTKNGFEMMLPEEYTVVSQSSNEEENGCIEGEVVNFYVYKKDNAPADFNNGLGISEFWGRIKSSNYKQLESSKKDGSFCGPVYDDNEMLFLFKAPGYELNATSLQVLKPIQSASCDISQVIRRSGKNGDTLEMNTNLTSLPLDPPYEDWKNTCPILFEKNNSPELQKKISVFEKIAQSVKFN